MYEKWDFTVDEMIEAVRPCVCCRHPDKVEKGQTIHAGRSKVGGLPDLPADLSWPEGDDGRLAFVAQIDLEEVKPLDLQGSLPGAGMLYLFAFADGDMAYSYELEGEECLRLLHTSSAELHAAEAPDDLEFDVFPECPLIFHQGLCVVNSEMGHDIKDAVLGVVKDLVEGGIHVSLGQPAIFNTDYQDYFGDDEELLFSIPAYDFGLGELGEAEIFAAVDRAKLKEGKLEAPNLIVLPGT